VCAGAADSVSLLIDYAASSNVADREGYTPLHYATARYPNTSIAKLLIASGTYSPFLINYVISLNGSLYMSLFVCVGADVNAISNDRKFTPLMLCAFDGKSEVYLSFHHH
jgi:ankyrin repeat protein